MEYAVRRLKGSEVQGYHHVRQLAGRGCKPELRRRETSTRPFYFDTPCCVFAFLEEITNLDNQGSGFSALKRGSLAVAAGLSIAGKDGCKLASNEWKVKGCTPMQTVPLEPCPSSGSISRSFFCSELFASPAARTGALVCPDRCRTAHGRDRMLKTPRAFVPAAKDPGDPVLRPEHDPVVGCRCDQGNLECHSVLLLLLRPGAWMGGHYAL